MLTVGEERLLTLAKFLREQVDPKHFCINSFCDFRNNKTIKECGSTACALGWATQIPAFRATGFKQVSAHDFMPKFVSQYGFNAARVFFQLSPEDVIYLFSAITPHLKTAKQVARAIEQLVARQQKERNART